MKTLVLEDGFSNERTINSLNEKFEHLLKLEEKTEGIVEAIVKNRNKMKFSRPIFLACGLYTTVTLFGYALLEIKSMDVNIYASIAVYNICMLAYIGYFVICEIAKHIKASRGLKFFCPTHWSSLFFSLTIPLIAFINWVLVENGVSFRPFSPKALDFWNYTSLVLTISGFAVTLIFTLAYYALSRLKINKAIKGLHSKYEELIAEKRKLDDTYAMFYKSDIELS